MEMKIPTLKAFQSDDDPRHCKIVGTIGPSSSDFETKLALAEAGLNIARLNFSHGTHDDHRKSIEQIRRLEREHGHTVSILQDLQGPKIRVGKLIEDKQQLESGQKLKLCFGVEQSERSIIPIDYRDLVKDVAVGERVLMDDGLLRLRITGIQNQEVEVLVESGGLLKNRKGVNFPDTELSLPAMTEKDSRDLLFGISQGVDFVALSFVQKPEDVLHVKRMIQALGADVPVIAKIEKLSAIERIDEIAKISDGLMVARGDLGVEGSVEKVPGFQRRIIKAASAFSKPVIIATQMLESMIENPRATLAEIADVANGVLDGADCVMLSGEVASGKYPVECVKQMAAIIKEVEAWTFHRSERYEATSYPSDDENWEDHTAIARAACEAADSLGAKAIVCLTLTGSIARLIANWRPVTPVIAISPRRDVILRLSVVWGVYGVLNPLFYNTDVLLQDLPDLLKKMQVADSGDVILITAGIPINQMRPTNMIKINRIP